MRHVGNHVNFQFTFVLEALSTFLTNLNNTIYQRYNIHYVFDIWFFFSNENVIASSQSQLGLHVNIEKQNLTLLEN